PLSNNSQLLDLYPPKYGLADPPMSAEVDVIDVPQVILRNLEQMLPDLVESVDDYVPGPADDSSDFAKSLPLLRSLAFVAQASPGLLGAGGGGGGGRPEGSALQGVPTELLLTVGKLLEFL